ncbi:ATP-binding protein [Brucella pseudogrignonensis]|uniref:ATP-binding protein n=1 Tax=Brucella pseudogrignonensis TaxID=419475 RepID=UPI0038D071CC
MPQSRLYTKRILKWYWTFAVLVIALASSAAALSIYKDYSVRTHDAGQKAMMFAQALSEQTTQIVASLDALSHAVINDLSDSNRAENSISDELHRRAQGETKAVIGIAIVNQFGRVSATGIDTLPVGSDLSHSEEFKTLSRRHTPDVFINHPNVQEINTPQSCIGQTMTYSRIIYGENQKFLGLILILVNEHYLYSFYDRFEVEPDIVLGLVGSDGVIRASNYGLAIGRNIKSYIEKELTLGQGIQVRDSPIVDHELILAYYKSSAAPLWAYAGFPTAPIYMAWLTATIVMVAALMGFFSVMIACGVLLAKYLNSQKELLRRDIETIKEKQELEIFQTIAGASDLLMVVTNSEGQIIVANQNFRTSFGEINRTDSLPFEAVLGIKMQALRDKPSWQGTHNIQISGGERREMSWVVSIIRGSELAEVRNFVILGLDITERRETELAVYQSGKLLTLGQMATGIAHELSQPLATLAIMLDNLEHAMVQKTHDSGSALEQITEMSRQVERASTIAQHMRIYGHKTDGALAVLDPIEIVTSVLSLCQEQIQTDSITIETEFNTLNTSIVGNQILIEQILLNFMVNARDSLLSKGGGAARAGSRIRIGCKVKSSKLLSLFVKDNGTGLDKDVKEKIFEPFFTTKDQGQGMGLGLALCHGMAKDMKGYIEADNLDEGAIFSLILPIA